MIDNYNLSWLIYDLKRKNIKDLRSRIQSNDDEYSIYSEFKKMGLVYKFEICTYDENFEASKLVNVIMSRLMKQYKNIKIISIKYDNVNYGKPGQQRRGESKLGDYIISSNMVVYFKA